jgi:hypothetical protein
MTFWPSGLATVSSVFNNFVHGNDSAGSKRLPSDLAMYLSSNLIKDGQIYNL